MKNRTMKLWQTTLADRVELEGCGVHAGVVASIILHPAPAYSGISFFRTDINHSAAKPVAARHRNVAATDLATVIGDPSIAAVSTIEHLMAALYGMGVDNVLVEIHGPEVPILDGSAEPFVDAIDEVGIVELDAPRRYLKVLKAVRIENGEQFGEFTPADGFHLDVTIDFAARQIGRQHIAIEVAPDQFRRDLCRARTFGFMSDVKRLWQAGYALGASLDNTLVFGEYGIVNPEGARFADECVRHKALDAVGDLALAGLPLLGRYSSHRGGHRLNAAVLGALLADPSAYEIVEADAVRARTGERRAVRGGSQASVAQMAAYTPHR